MKHSSECDRYRVEVSASGQAIVSVCKEDSTFFVPQKFLVTSVADLIALFTAIGSVLSEIQNEQ